MTKALKLAIGIPAYRGAIVAYQAQMWLSMGQALAMFGTRFEIVLGLFVDINPVSRARNRLLYEAAVKAQADWLFTIDSDTWVEPYNEDNPLAAGHAILRMIAEADLLSYQVVSAAVRVSNSSDKVAAYQRFEDGSSKQYEAHELRKDLQPIDEVGAACIAVHVPSIVLNGIKFEFTDELSEDREFCRQARAKGLRIAIDGRVRTGHLSKPFPLYTE